jgi:hypothetical protein
MEDKIPYESVPNNDSVLFVKLVFHNANYNVFLAKVLGGDVPASIFVREILILHSKHKTQESVWKMDKEFYDEYGLSVEECNRVRNKLKKLGILVIHKPAKNMYSINFNKLDEFASRGVK